MHRETNSVGRRPRPRLHICSIAIGLLTLLGAQTAHGESNWRDRFELYGHFTLAYAENELDRPRPLSIEEQILGIPEDGTFDYLLAALQARFRIAEGHTLVAQATHRQFDDSPIGDLTDDTELD